MATELIPSLNGDSDPVSNWPATWEFARLARQSLAFTHVAASYTAAIEDHVLLVSASAGAVTITLPTAASMVNRVFRVKAKSVAGGNITVDAAGAETIDGAATVVLSTLYASVAIISDGTTWWKL